MKSVHVVMVFWKIQVIQKPFPKLRRADKPKKVDLMVNFIEFVRPGQK